MIENRILFNITAASLEKYLLFKDWKRDYDFKNKKQMVFYLDDETIVIPASEKYKDFYMILPKVLESLSEIYKKSIYDIIKEITSSYHDLLEFRIKSKISEDGELPLGYASDCIEGLKDLILYSACAENQTEAVCLRTTNNAKQVLDNFKLAQTEVGSFIINIDIKVVDEENEQLILHGCQPAPSLEHKIVKRIGKAIQQIDDIATKQSQIDEILPTAYESGVTANICDALMKLKPENGDAEIEAKIRYASAMSQRLDDVEAISISGNHFYVMDEISRRYRTSEEPQTETLHGYVKSLKKDPTAKGRYKREISMLIYDKEGFRSVKAELGEEDYNNACDAHKDGQQIEIRGILDISNKNWRFIHVESFKVLEEQF